MGYRNLGDCAEEIINMVGERAFRKMMDETYENEKGGDRYVSSMEMGADSQMSGFSD